MKKGFTLIEVMVVIVIMGILAAVAIPKLFGNVAKAKASEIPAAAATYVHMQNAYLGASSVLGNWNQIGYEAPGSGATGNFCYSQGTLTDTMSVSRIEGGIFGWGATNKVGLSNCGISSWWSIQIVANGANDANYLQNVSADECAPLVHNWQVGSTLTGGCEAPAVSQQEPAQQPAPETQAPEQDVSTGTQPTTQPTEEKQESPQTPPSKEVNMEEYYTYTNGEYQKCNPNGGDGWLNGQSNGSACQPLRQLLVENGDVVHKQNNQGEDKKNQYEFKDENARCLVTRDCTDDAYAAALEQKRSEEDAKKQAEEEAKRKAEEEAAAAANSSSSATQCKDNKGKTCNCSEGGNCKPVH